MKFTKEQQDFIKNACEHIEVLTGGRSKTKEMIEDMQREIERLNNIINELEKELDLNLPFKVVGVRRLKNELQKLKGDSSDD